MVVNKIYWPTDQDSLTNPADWLITLHYLHKVVCTKVCSTNSFFSDWLLTVNFWGKSVKHCIQPRLCKTNNCVWFRDLSLTKEVLHIRLFSSTTLHAGLKLFIYLDQAVSQAYPQCATLIDAVKYNDYYAYSSLMRMMRLLVLMSQWHEAVLERLLMLRSIFLSQ